MNNTAKQYTSSRPGIIENTREHHATTQQLITDIERKDQRFRLALTALATSTMILVLMIMMLQYSQLKQQQKNVQTTRNYIGCIARFFAVPNRQTKQISDIDRCTIEPAE